MYELDEHHASFDEDVALEAYEEMIQVGAAAKTASVDALSLTPMLLAKHFYKFPHVHMNVVDVLLALCERTQPGVVRIHAVRALFTVTKQARTAKPLLATPCRDRIVERMGEMATTERSKVVARQWQLVHKALGVAADDTRSEEPRKTNVEPRGKMDTQQRSRGADAPTQDKTAKQPSQNGNQDARRDDVRDDRRRDRIPSSSDRPPQQEQAPTRERRMSSGGRETTTNLNSQGCPPSPFLFIGGVPRDTASRDIVNYLSCIDENIHAGCVQVKFSGGSRGPAGYAFVTMASTDHARRAIRHIHTTEFNGRTLIGDFARGPPCATLQFVERNKDVARMHDANAVRNVDVDKLDKRLWDNLCAQLARFGSLEPSGRGRARFRDMESAKSAIRQSHFTVQGREFLAVYDLDEQMLLDSSRRLRPPTRDEARSRYGANATRSDSRDREKKRPRSPSPGNRATNGDKVPRQDPASGRNGRRRDFDQARYGPRDSPSQPQPPQGDRRRSRSPVARPADAGGRSRSAERRRDEQNPRRSASPKPRPQQPSDRDRPMPRHRSPPRQPARGRSRSPPRDPPPSNEPGRRENPTTKQRSPSPRRDTGADARWPRAQRDNDRAAQDERQRPAEQDAERNRDAKRNVSPPRRNVSPPCRREDENRVNRPNAPPRERSPPPAAPRRADDASNRRGRSRSPVSRQPRARDSPTLQKKNDEPRRRSRSPRPQRGSGSTGGGDPGRPQVNGSNRGRDTDAANDLRSSDKHRTAEEQDNRSNREEHVEMVSPPPAARASPPPPPKDTSGDSNPHVKSPRRPFESREPSAYEVDELMVDYEEDEE